MYGWQIDHVGVLSFLAVAYSDEVRDFTTGKQRKNRGESELGRESECGEHDGCEEELIGYLLLAFFLSSQESFQKILAFLFDVVGLG